MKLSLWLTNPSSTQDDQKHNWQERELEETQDKTTDDQEKNETIKPQLSSRRLKHKTTPDSQMKQVSTKHK